MITLVRKYELEENKPINFSEIIKTKYQNANTETMSRRHKEYPSISKTEVMQVAKETAERAVRHTSIPLLDRIEVKGIRINPKNTARSYAKHITKKLTESLYASLTASLSSKGLIMVDEPDATIHPLGRPMVMQLYDRFKDTDVISMLKDIYWENYHQAITTAKNMIDQFICFMLAMCSYTDTSPTGLAAHFHRLLKVSFPTVKLMSLRTFQKKINWFSGFRKVAKWAKEKEKKAYEAWRKLKQMYLEGIENFAPKYAC